MWGFVDFSNLNNHGAVPEGKQAARTFAKIGQQATNVQVVHIPPRAIPRQLISADSLTLPWDALADLAKANDVDALITLDRFAVHHGNVFAELQPREDTRGGEVIRSYFVFVAELPVTSTSTWRYLLPTKQEQVDIVEGMEHTVMHYAEHEDYASMMGMFSTFPDTGNLAAQDAAYGYAGRVLAAPTKSPRKWYDAGKFAAGHSDAVKGNWRAAIDKWRNVMKKSKGKKQLKAKFNMAVAQEMLGEFGRADELLQEVERGGFDGGRIAEYRQRLNDRRANNKRLERMGIEQKDW